MQAFLYDLRSAARSVRRSPGFALVVVLILGIAIGANGAIFSIINGVLLEPLPYPQADRIVALWEGREPGEELRTTPATFLAWQERNSSFEEITVYLPLAVTMSEQGERSERVEAALVWPNYFSVLGLDAAHGRTFRPEEAEPGKGNVVVLSHEMWTSRFGADRALLDRSIDIDGEAHTVVGVMPPSDPFPREARMWFPLMMSEDAKGNLGSHYLLALGRLAPDASLASAQADMDAIALRLGQEYPDYKEGWKVRLETLQESLVGDTRSTLLMFQWAVLLVLLIACANVTNLQIERAAARRRELAMRSALGADRRRLLRQLVAESVVLALLGSLLGLGLASLAIAFVRRSQGDQLARLENVGLDPTTVLFTLTLAILAGIAIGMVAAWRSSRANLTTDLKEGGGAVGGSGGRLREVLAVVEVALALILLVGAGLLVNSFLRLSQVDPGIDPSRALTLRTQISGATYPELMQQRQLYDRLVREIGSLPGVTAVGLSNDLPVSGTADWQNEFVMEGERLDRRPSEQTMAYLRWVSPETFDALGMKLLRGRGLRDGDTEESPLAVVVDQAFVDSFFPGRDPIGLRMYDIGVGDVYVEQGRLWEIVGVVSNVREAFLDEPPQPHYYVSYRQAPFLPNLALVVRTGTDPASMIGPVRDALYRIDPALPVYDMATLEAKLAETLAERRFTLVLVALFAAAALLLAAIGIYAVIAYSVSRRTREIGIRMALGAERGTVLKLILGKGALLAALGVAFGLVSSLALNRFLASFLYEIRATDPATLLAVVGLMVGVVLLASYVPARRATRIEPVRALRYE